jgi:hypothetical protein
MRWRRRRPRSADTPCCRRRTRSRSPERARSGPSRARRAAP